MTNARIFEEVQQILQQGFTGIINISYLLGEELTLLVKGGEIIEILMRDKNIRQHLPGDRFANLFEPSRMGSMNLLNTPARYLRVVRACFDSHLRDIQKSLPNSDLANLFSRCQQRESATIIHLRWNSAQAYVLVPGANLSSSYAVFFHGEQIELDEAALQAMSAWREASCDLTQYQGALETASWIEIHLTFLFEYLCSYMLNQYAILTGRATVNSVIRNMIFTAQNQGCEITAAGTQLQVHTMFESVSVAAPVYSSLVSYMYKQMGALIGSGFIDNLKKHIRNSLNSFYLNILSYYGL